MKFFSFLVALLFVCFSHANETITFNTDLNVAGCKDLLMCSHPLYTGSPISVELSPMSATSSVLFGEYEIKKVLKDLSFVASVKVYKIPAGPDKGYFFQVWLISYKGQPTQFAPINLGAILTDDPSKLNRTSFKFTLSETEDDYIAVVTLGPKS